MKNGLQTSAAPLWPSPLPSATSFVRELAAKEKVDDFPRNFRPEHQVLRTPTETTRHRRAPRSIWPLYQARSSTRDMLMLSLRYWSACSSPSARPKSKVLSCLKIHLVSGVRTTGGGGTTGLGQRQESRKIKISSRRRKITH